MRSTPRTVAALIAVLICFITCRNESQRVSAETNQENRKKVAEYYYPVIYDSMPSIDDQWGFETIPAYRLRVKLIPNIKNCEEQGLMRIDSIFGVNQFLLDMDLTDGFVHPYTVNFFNKLSADDYVLKYERAAGKFFEGNISFIRKKEITLADTLGKNLGYFRQWKLSEIVHNDSIEMRPCGFAKSCLCPQATGNYFKEVAIAACLGIPGKYPVADFDMLNNTDGGTVCLLWEDSASGKIFFKDVHGSLARIVSEAKEIAASKHTDPVLAISDAGIVSRKFRAENFTLNLAKIKKLAPHAQIAAGYGYVPVKFTLYSIHAEGEPERLDTVREETF